MGKFRIQSHGRLQEWVAEEKGYFKDEGLDYEFIVKPIITWAAGVENVQSSPGDIQRGAFESFEDGRGCNVSAACHWTAWEHAWCNTHAPIGTMRPVSSANGMNAAGDSSPRSGCFHRRSASKPITRPVRRSMIGW